MKYEGMIPLETQMEGLSHMPDLLFSKFCNETFEINRGIYNVIDQFFFHKGFVNIVERRKVIMMFCQYVNKKGKIGPGGLTLKLNTFLRSGSFTVFSTRVAKENHETM